MHVHKSCIHNCQRWKQFKCPSLSFNSPSVGEWINILLQCKRILLSNKKEKILKCTTWMYYNGIMLCKISQSFKVTYHIVPVSDIFEKKTTEMGSHSVVSKSGDSGQSMTTKGQHQGFWGDFYFGGGYMNLRTCKNSQNCIPKIHFIVCSLKK